MNDNSEQMVTGHRFKGSDVGPLVCPCGATLTMTLEGWEFKGECTCPANAATAITTALTSAKESKHG